MGKILFVTLTIVFFVASCAKRKANRSTEDFQDYSIAEVGFNDALKVAESAMSDSSLTKSVSYFKSAFGSCTVVSIDPPSYSSIFPKTLVVDFGTGCTDSYGIERSGKITATMTDKYRNVGSITTLTTQNYAVEGYKIEGTKTITNKGRNADNNLEYAIEITGGKITFPSGEATTIESSRTRTWVGGETTIFNPFDDIYEITGTANGTSREGRKYVLKITSALRVKLNCRWVTNGTMEIQPEDLKLRVVDFGDGTCDDDATVTIGKRSYNVTMK